MRLTRRQFLMLGAAVLASPPFSAAATAQPVSQVPVLLYRDIRHRSADPACVPPPVFAAQMERLYSSGYRAISFADLPGLNAEAAQRSLILSFDGGYVSFMTHAFPLLSQYGFKANVNIIGRYTGTFAARYDPRLSWDECRTLAQSGLIEIGCQPAGMLPAQKAMPPSRATATMNERLSEELSAFQNTFRQEMGSRALILAWPQDTYDRLSIEIAKNAGFRYLLGSEFRHGAISRDVSGMPRLRPGREQDLAMFEQLLEKKP